jgi:uncharacterized repeat protein (TIGR01451 family)/CSLREA domain-containing protein
VWPKLFLALSVVALALLVAHDLAAVPTATYTVNATTGYDGTCDSHCSLRDAINEANTNIGPDTIGFNISGSSPFTMSMGFQTISDPVIIDGYTQPGASPATSSAPATIQIEVIGTLDITAGGSTVKGLAIYATNHVGIRLMTLGGNTIQGNYIGTDASGSVAKGYSTGVSISDSSSNTIGGTSPAERNIISGNGTSGINIYGSSSAGNVVTGNYIGTDPTGTMAVPNFNGVSFQATSNNSVGGSTAAEANLISGNKNIGVLFTNGSVSNQIKGNIIGLDAPGTAFLPNKTGVYVWGYQSFIGGTSQSEGNVIAGNSDHGIEVSSPFTGTTILYNQIFENGKLGIELGTDGVTSNDTGDVDTGPNDLQNYPILTEVSSLSGITTTITGTLNSTPNTNFWLQFFVNGRCDHTAHGEGESFIGDWLATTDGAGDASFEAAFGLPLPNGMLVTASATNVDTGDTSEFARCVQVNQAIASADLQVAKADSLDPVVEGSLLVYLVDVTNTGPFAATDVVITDTLPISVSFAAAFPSQGSCSQSGRQVICDLLILADGQAANVEISVFPTATGTIDNDVLVSSIEPDPNQNDNSNNQSTLVVPSVPMTFIVNSTDDNVDARPGDRLCEVRLGGGICTLRAAIMEANYLPSDDTIILPSSTYTLTISGNKEDDSTTGDLDVTGDLSILGADAATTIIDANQLDRVFEMCPGGKYGVGTQPTIHVTLSDVTIRGGNGGGETCDQYSCGVDTGGGIENWSCGDLTVASSVIRDNTALNGPISDQYSYPDGLGGGLINSGGSVALTNTTVISNTTGEGGGIFNTGTMTITDSVVISNTAASGGGIWSNGTVSMTNSIVAFNVADNDGEMWRVGSGGGIYVAGINSQFIAWRSEISQNEARGVVTNPFNAYLAHGAGIYGDEGYLELRETRVISNTADGEGGGAFVYQGWIYGYRSLIALNVPDGIGNRGYLYLENSTVTSNTVTAIETWSTWTTSDPPIIVQSLTWLEYSTIAGNGSRGLDNGGYVVVPMRGSLLADHPGGNWLSASVGQYSPLLASYGYNLVDDATTPLTLTTDLTNTNPMLGSLQDNGGPTMTLAPLPGSPAIDAIPRASCQVNRDQRGFPRPIGPGCDIGAYEFAQLNSCSAPVVAIPNNDSTGISDTINITYTDTIVDLEVFVEATHTYVGDLAVALEHVGTGTQVTLIDRPGVPASTFGCDGENVSAQLDDEAAAAVEDQCAATSPAIGGIFRPNEALSLFDGELMAGNWTLFVADLAPGDTGTLEQWCLVADYEASSPTAIRIAGIRATSGPASRMRMTLSFLAMLVLTFAALSRVLGKPAVGGDR